MPPSSQHRDRRLPRQGALVVYVIAWLAVGAVAAALAIVVLRGQDDDVALPPVQEIDLTRAAEHAGCRLQRGPQRGGRAPRIEGGRAAPALAGAYTTAQADEHLVGAMRRGAIVLHYRPDISDAELDRLRLLQASVPRATILVPQADMPYRLAATAWRRLLGCQQLNRHAVDAIRLFRGRYVGQGPEAAG